MLFNSLEFLFFLLIVLALHYLAIPADHPRARKRLLLVASYVFYMAWNPPFALLLLFSTALDFVLALRIEGTSSRSRRRLLLGLSLLGNLGILGYFKYGAFIAENVRPLLGPLGQGGQLEALDVILPVGISFYTFQSLSYTLDVYRGQQAATRRFLDLALYVSFFPQLVAGPIVRARTFLPQIEQPSTPQEGEVSEALIRIAVGLVKKVVFADTLGAYVDPIFSFPDLQSGLTILLAIYAYAYQIYFDFSGYSDIAIGLARLFGIRLPENFDRPYLADSPRDFWRRWHISLSTWLRDYLYISMGGSRKGPARTQLSLFTTMLLGGLWHGAAWNFVVWGAYHGVLLAFQRVLFGTHSFSTSPAARALRQIVTFHLICLGWLIFRAPTLEIARILFERMWAWNFAPSESASQAIAILVVSAGLHVLTSRLGVQAAFLRAPAWLQGVGYAAVAVLVLLFAPVTQRFIYFQF